MCTVSFIPSGRQYFFTSNRDEAVLRLPALRPQIVPFESGNIVFPKDGAAGGTWIAGHENGNVMILLNGAFVRHKHQPPYRKSRGLIFLEIFDSHAPLQRFTEVDLTDIEPFTLVIFQDQQLWDARWDGQERHVKSITTTEPHFWSSATLYDDAIREKREAWFATWLRMNPVVDSSSIHAFHRFGGIGDSRNDLRMSRDGILQTVSITGIRIAPQHASMMYEDLQQETISIQDWTLSRAVAS